MNKLLLYTLISVASSEISTFFPLRCCKVDSLLSKRPTFACRTMQLSLVNAALKLYLESVSDTTQTLVITCNHLYFFKSLSVFTCQGRCHVCVSGLSLSNDKLTPTIRKKMMKNFSCLFELCPTQLAQTIDLE